jgi:hypothetical protein
VPLFLVASVLIVRGSAARSSSTTIKTRLELTFDLRAKLADAAVRQAAAGTNKRRPMPTRSSFLLKVPSGAEAVACRRKLIVFALPSPVRSDERSVTNTRFQFVDCIIANCIGTAAKLPDGLASTSIRSRLRSVCGEDHGQT